MHGAVGHRDGTPAPAPARRSSWTLRRQVAAACLAVAVVPGMLVAIVAYGSLRTAAEDQAVQEIGTIADLQAERIEGVLQRLESSADEWRPGTIAAQGMGLALVAGSESGLDDFSSDLIRTAIENHMASEPDVRAVLVLDNDGVVTFSSDPAWIGARLPLQRWAAGPELVMSDGEIRLRDGRSIFVGGARVGHVLIESSLRDIITVSQDYTALGATGETSVAMRTGDDVRVVSGYRFDTGAPTVLPADSALPIAAATRGEVAIDQSARDYRGVAVVAATRPIPGTSWGVVVKQDRAEVLSAVDDLGNIFVFGSLATVLVAALAAWVLSSRLTEPVEHLTDTAAAIASGSDVRAERNGPRELSTLAGALNAMADALERQTRADPLTALPNRVVLEARLAETIGAVRAGYRQVAVLFCDLDHFKVVNDTRGHGMGDELLSEVARRLEHSVRSGDLVCRFGGDEFVIVLDGVADRVDLDRRSARVHGALREPIELAAGVEVHVTMSVGAAFVTGHDDVETLLGNADSAMYEAKASGRGQTVVFSHHLRDRVEQRSATAAALRTALDGREIEVHYQPIVDVSTGADVALEALVRWRRDGTMVGPATFLEVAKDQGLMPRLGDLVFGQVCADLALLAPETLVHVNVSVTELCDPTFVARVLSHVRAVGGEPGRLCLEVTEEMLLDETARMTLDDARQHGFLVAVDDFGAGYSSLGLLRTLPADVLKLDRSLIADIAASRADADIVHLVVALGDRLGLTVVAEGVETDEQHRALRDMGCPQAQGWRYAAAMSVAQLAQRESAAVRAVGVPPAGVEPAT